MRLNDSYLSERRAWLRLEQRPNAWSGPFKLWDIWVFGLLCALTVVVLMVM